VRLPLFSGGSTAFAVRAAEADERRRAAALDRAYREAARAVADAAVALADAAERIAVQEAFLQAGLVRAEIGRAQYTNGMLSFEDWDTIENELIQYQKALLVRQQAAVAAAADWEQAQGKGILP